MKANRNEGKPHTCLKIKLTRAMLIDDFKIMVEEWKTKFTERTGRKNKIFITPAEGRNIHFHIHIWSRSQLWMDIIEESRFVDYVDFDRC